MDTFVVYILKSESSGCYYIGQTQCLENRLKAHLEGRSEYTKSRGPWILIAYKPCSTRSEAVILERKLKNFKSSTRLQQWMLSSDGPVMLRHDEDPRNISQS